MLPNDHPFHYNRYHIDIVYYVPVVIDLGLNWPIKSRGSWQALMQLCICPTTMFEGTFPKSWDFLRGSMVERLHVRQVVNSKKVTLWRFWVYYLADMTYFYSTSGLEIRGSDWEIQTHLNPLISNISSLIYVEFAVH